MIVDPISIIGLAANILQFVDFGSRLPSESRIIYQSCGAASDADAEIEIVTEHLQSYLRQFSACDPNSPSGYTVSTLSASGVQVHRLANTCFSVARKRREAVEELKMGL